MGYARGFGKRLSKIMWARGLSAYRLAWETGTHVNTVYGWLSGRHTPRIWQLPALRKALNCSYEELIEGKGKG